MSTSQDHPTEPEHSAPPGRRERKKQQVRDLLSTTALTLFAERGFENTTVEDITEAADVSRTTFFRYFDSKEAVVVGYLQDLGQQAGEAVLARPPDEPPMRALRAALIELAAAQQQHGDPLAELIDDLRRNSPVVRTAYLAKMDDWQRSLSERLAQRMKLDETALEPRLYAAVAMAAVSSATVTWEARGRRDDVIALLHEAFDKTEQLQAVS